jgi:hypothetical protein
MDMGGGSVCPVREGGSGMAWHAIEETCLIISSATISRKERQRQRLIFSSRIPPKKKKKAKKNKTLQGTRGGL